MKQRNENPSIDDKLKELDREAKFKRRLGIGGVATGAIMCLPAMLASQFGYDMQTIDTTYETVAGISMLTALVPIAGGLIMYVEGNVEYFNENGRNSGRRGK